MDPNGRLSHHFAPPCPKLLGNGLAQLVSLNHSLRVHGERVVVLVRLFPLQQNGRLRGARRVGLGYRRRRELLRYLLRVPEQAERLPRLEQRSGLHLQLYHRQQRYKHSNTPGSYLCTCPRGYRVETALSCSNGRCGRMRAQ
jgi:hypothetical protein